jgi:hypothetical protein
MLNTVTGHAQPNYLEIGPYQDPSLPKLSVGFADLRVYR